MSAEERCDFTDLYPSMCSHCRGLDLDDTKPELAHQFTAKFTGYCAICSEGFGPGDEVWRLRHGGFCCGECAASGGTR